MTSYNPAVIPFELTSFPQISKSKSVRVELVLRALANALALSDPIELSYKSKVVKVEWVLSTSASALAPLDPIELSYKSKVLRVELVLSTSA
ncbi:hypothetical protein BGX24_003106, partial [Mortierella sp. AD032]